MSEPLRRALRTLLQMLAGVLTTGGLMMLGRLVGVEVDTDLAALLVVVLTPLLAWAQNSLEDRGKVRPVLGTKFQD